VNAPPAGAESPSKDRLADSVKPSVDVGITAVEDHQRPGHSRCEDVFDFVEVPEQSDVEPPSSRTSHLVRKPEHVPLRPLHASVAAAGVAPISLSPPAVPITMLHQAEQRCVLADKQPDKSPAGDADPRQRRQSNMSRRGPTVARIGISRTSPIAVAAMKFRRNSDPIVG